MVRHEVQAVLNAHKSESSSKPVSTTCYGRPDKTNVCKVDVNAASVACKDSGSQQCGSTEHANLERVIDMLEKVLMRNSFTRQPSSGRRYGRLPRIDGLDVLPCAICNDGAHSALVHCREHRLCFSACHLAMPDATALCHGLLYPRPHVPMTDSLFYTPVSVENGPTLKALIDSGSMACTISETAEANLLEANPNLIKTPADNVVVVGCGGQTEELIIGSNAIKPLLTLLRSTGSYWKLMNMPSGDGMDESFQFLSLLSNTERWKGDIVPDKVGTAKLKGSVTLQPRSEYLVWGKLPSKAMVSVGSTVVIEPTQSNSRPKQILVGRIITPLFGDGLVPVKLVNPTDRPVTLRRNAKIADVSPCIAVEDFTEVESVQCNIQSSAQSCHISEQPLLSEEELTNILRDLGLNDLDLSAYFVHRIRLVDDKPFRLPYRRIPPSHYEKLRTALNEMEECGIIRKSNTKAKPLFKLISQQDTQCFKTRRRHSKKKAVNVKLTPSDWTEECKCAFETLKHDLLTSVTLAHPDFDGHFILAVDASFDGLGAVLSQIPRGSDMARPVAFASKTLSRSQMNYPAHSAQLEFLALKWAVCDKFHYWLKGRHFTAWTDNNPLTYILTKPRLDACEQRWVAKLASYSFDLKYVPGAKNIVADALSREPFVKSCVSHRLVTEPYHALLNQLNGVRDETVQDAFRCTNNCQLVSTDVEPGSDLSLTLSQGKLTSQEISALLDAHCSGGTSRVMGTGVIPHLEKEDCTTALPKSTLLTMQEQDGTVSRVVYYIRRHKRPDKRERAKEPRSVIKLLKHWNKLTLQDGMLFKVKRDHNMNKQLYQFIVPDCLKQQVLHGIHDAAGHQGRSRTLSLARHRFFWTGMAHDIVHYVRNCKRCIVGKTPEPDARAPLENIHTTEPMELICIDFWSAEQGDKSVDVLVATDHFTKMAFAFPCKNQSAKQVARRLWDDIFCIYGFPKRVHSDQGANFTSKLIKELLDMAEIKKSHTTPYHPMGNGITERFNRTLGSMIRALPPKSKAKWPQSLRVLTFCYNCTVHETTGFAPFYLIWEDSRLPIDVMFQHVLKNDLVITHSEFVSNLKRDLSEAAKVAQRHSSAEQARHAKLYDRKVKGSPLTVGDRVLLANRGERGKRKVADKWESTAYEVLSVRSAINVYRVKDTVTGKEKTVHRNLLLPVSFLLRDHEVDLSSDSLSVGARSDQGDPLPCEQLDSDEKTLRWILQSGENAELDEVVVMIPSSSNPVENTHVDDVVDDSHGCTGQDRDVSQSSFLDDQSAHSHSVQLPTDSPADPHSHVPSSVDSESDEPVVNQPRRGMTMTRIGRTIKPPKRLICEMNDQVVEDSRSSVSSFVTLMRHVFAV
ncbi:interleukin-1 receptor accessory protein-like 1-A [Pimephales promelas]|nr:interleukin-1 receptor accessory protein-like 1-A [Pimephales promelas]